MTAESCESLCS